MRARTDEPDWSGGIPLESFHAPTNDLSSSATIDGLTWSLPVVVASTNSSPTAAPVGRRMRPNTSQEPGPVSQACHATMSAPSERGATPNALSDAKSEPLLSVIRIGEPITIGEVPLAGIR